MKKILLFALSLPHRPTGKLTAPAPESVSHALLVLGSSIVAFLFTFLLASSLGFILRMPITSGHFFLSAGITVIYAFSACCLRPCRKRVGEIWAVLFCLAVSFSFSLVVSGHFFDISYDGQGYHQEAIIQLDRGWNPFYERMNGVESNNMDRWLNHYSKGVWFWAAGIFKITGDIESGKLFHLWLVVASLCFALSFLWRYGGFPRWTALLMSVLIAANPVSIYQSLSFYLDGQLMSLLVILVVVLGFIYREPKWFYFSLLCLVIPVLVNVKLTAGMYTGLIMVSFMVLLGVKRRFLELRRTFSCCLIAFLLGFVLLGYNPYITNTLEKGNPFYPALGTDRSDYTYPQFPANFTGRCSVFLLFYSIFSKSDNVRGMNKQAYLKIPFTVSKGELSAFTDTNAKQGGFGPLFGGAMLLSLLILMAVFRTLYSSSIRSAVERGRAARGNGAAQQAFPADLGLGFFSLGAILLTCLINPASSLARFVPQMWLFPMIALFMAYTLRTKKIRILGHLLLVALVVNNLLIGYSYYQYNFQTTRLYKQRLAKMAVESEMNPIPIYFGHFLTSNTLRFDRLGISYARVGTKEECGKGQRILPNSILLKCEAK